MPHFVNYLIPRRGLKTTCFPRAPRGPRAHITQASPNLYACEVPLISRILQVLGAGLGD